MERINNNFNLTIDLVKLEISLNLLGAKSTIK